MTVILIAPGDGPTAAIRSKVRPSNVLVTAIADRNCNDAEVVVAARRPENTGFAFRRVDRAGIRKSQSLLREAFYLVSVCESLRSGRLLATPAILQVQVANGIINL